MAKCIICRKDKEDMSDEHVIPDSLGGYYHIKTVCRCCNSHLGTKVDTHLVNNKFSELYRSKYNIKGKKGGIPNPFSDTFINESNPEMKATIRKNKNGTIESYFMPFSEIKYDSEGNAIGLEICLDEVDLDKQEEILNKILERNKFKKSDVKLFETKKIENDTAYKTTWSMDFEKMKIGALKIAYEFAVDKIPSYYFDPVAKKISDILFNADLNAANKYVNVGDGINEEIMKPFESFLELKSNKHYLILTNNRGKLFCLIKINDVYVIGVTLSNKKYFEFDSSLIGINDVDNKIFKSIKLMDALNEISGPILLKFLYQGVDISSQEEGFELFEHTNHMTLKDIVPLYHANGTCIAYAHEVIKKANPYHDIVSAVSKFGSKFSYQLPKSNMIYHIRSKHTHNLYPIDTIEIHQNWKERL